MQGSLIAAASAVALLLTAGTSLVRLDKLERTGGSFWLLTLGAVVTACFGLSWGLQARALLQSAEAFRELEVVSASELRRDRQALLNRPVVVTDVATCIEGKGASEGAPVLASRSKIRGEDEVEGEESDYITSVDYGVEQEGNRFRLGDEALAVKVDPDSWQVWPAGFPEQLVRTTGEFSAVAGRNLQETVERTVIPCGARVSITGLVTEEGPYLTLTPLRPPLSLLTDRPWQAVLDQTQRQAEGRVPEAAAMGGLALLMALIQLGIAVWMTRREARG